MIGIVGAGAFGTALAVALAQAGRPVRLWARDARLIADLRDQRRNPAALPGVVLPENVSVHAEIAEICGGQALLLAVPMQALGGVLDLWPVIDTRQPLVACCKGVDLATLRGPVTLIEVRRPGAVAAILTGPSFAADIARGLPTALTLATAREGTALQELLSTPTLRLYRTDDVRGAGADLRDELGDVVALVERRHDDRDRCPHVRPLFPTRIACGLHRSTGSCAERNPNLLDSRTAAVGVAKRMGIRLLGNY